MKIVVIGGSGLIGSKVVSKLRALNHDVTPASPSTGVNTVTGEGLKEALHNAQIVIDVANSPTFEDSAALEFFKSAGRHIEQAEAAAGVKHHIALSVVGTEKLQDSGYFRAKMAQENLIKTSRIPYTLVRATQFFEFVNSIVQASVVGDEIHQSESLIQPIAAEDVAQTLVDIALSKPLNKMIEVAGPEKFQLDNLIRMYLELTHDSREVVTDNAASYFGVMLKKDALIPHEKPILGTLNFADWISQQ